MTDVAKRAATARRAWRKAVAQRAFRTVDAPDFVIEAVRRAEMDPRHAHLDELLEK